MARALARLPLTPPAIDDTRGKRETHNGSRLFVNEASRREYPVCATLAEAFQDEATIGLLNDMTGLDLTGSFVRDLDFGPLTGSSSLTQLILRGCTHPQLPAGLRALAVF